MPPEMTSFGNGAAASSSSGITASHGGRSAIAARAPCSSSGGSGSGRRVALPTSGRKTRRYVAGSCGPAAKKRLELCDQLVDRRDVRAPTPNAGGSLTVSERTSLRRAGRQQQRDDAAVRVADEMFPVAQ